MKKSFLKTCIVFSLFSIFLIGNITPAYAQNQNNTPSIGDRIWNSTLGFWGENGYGRQALGSVVAPVVKTLASPLVATADVIAQGTIMPLIQTGMVFYLKIIQFSMWVAGGVFDTIMKYTIEDQSLFKGFEKSINISWTIVRDISNIIIVFSLLYLGIKTILNGNGFAETRLLISIIIAAILINFSLVFTQTVFDVSNLVGRQIAQQIVFEGASTGYGGVSSISEGLMGMIRPDKIMGIMWTDLAQAGWSAMWDRVQISLITGVTMMFMVLIFIAAAFLLMSRFVIFIILMITSPIGVIAKFIPWLEKMGESWWSHLKKQAIVLPAFLLTLYISILFVSALSQNLNASALNMASGATISKEGAQGAVVFFFNYFLVIAFLLLPLIVPGKIGAAGSEMMTGIADWTTKKIKSAPRRTAGFAAGTASAGVARGGRAVLGGVVGRGLKDRETMKKWAQNTDKGLGGLAKRTFGQAVIKTGDGLQNKTYDIRNLNSVKKSEFGKDMGKGIEGWTKTIKAKKEYLEKKKKEEMKLFGFDKFADTSENRVATALKEAERDTQGQTVKEAKTLYDNTVKQVATNAAARGGTITAADTQLLKTTQDAFDAENKKLEKIEQAVGELKNKGESEYMKQLEGRVFAGHGGSHPSITGQRAFYDTQSDLNKKWKKEGQSSAKKAQAAKGARINNALNPTPTPPPTPPPATP